MKILINDLQIGFELRGIENNRLGDSAYLLVLIHGFGMDRSIWGSMVDNYLAGHLVLLPDMRGHGESEAPLGPYMMSLMAADLAALLEKLGFYKAIVCGHSMGGYVALAFADQFPHMVAGLGLITTNAKADPEDKRAGRYAMIEDIKQRGSLAVAENLAPRLSDDPAVVDFSHRLICATQPAGLMGALEGMAERADYSDLLEKIDVPAMVAAGTADTITNFNESVAMANALRQGVFLGITGAGHMPMVKTPGELGEGLFNLISRVGEFRAN